MCYWLCASCSGVVEGTLILLCNCWSYRQSKSVFYCYACLDAFGTLLLKGKIK